MPVVGPGIEPLDLLGGAGRFVSPDPSMPKHRLGPELRTPRARTCQDSVADSPPKSKASSAVVTQLDTQSICGAGGQRIDAAVRVIVDETSRRPCDG